MIHLLTVFGYSGQDYSLYTKCLADCLEKAYVHMPTSFPLTDEIRSQACIACLAEHKRAIAAHHSEHPTQVLALED